MTNHLKIAELMAENGNLRDTIDRLRAALEKARPYVAELANFAHSSRCHQELIEEIDKALGISQAYPWR